MLGEYQKTHPPLQVLARFDELPNSMLVVRASMTEEERRTLLEALGDVWTDATLSEVKGALEAGAAIDGLEPATVEALRSVGKWLDP